MKSCGCFSESAVVIPGEIMEQRKIPRKISLDAFSTTSTRDSRGAVVEHFPGHVRLSSVSYGPSKLKPTSNELNNVFHVLNDFGELIPFESKLDALEWSKNASEKDALFENLWREKIIPSIGSYSKDFSSEFLQACMHVPTSLRGQIWLRVSGALFMLKKNPDTYKELVSEQKGVLPRTIEVDIPRTHQEHVFFFNHRDGEHMLGRVLSAINTYLPTAGYVQGMNMIVSLFLIVLQNEEESFWLMVSFLTKYLMMDYYFAGLTRLQNSFKEFGALILSNMPDLHSHFIEESVEPFCYCTPWFLTLFTYNTSLSISAKIFDVFFLYAPGSQFVFRFGLAYMKINRELLLRMEFNDLVSKLRDLVINESNIIPLLEESFSNVDLSDFKPQNWAEFDFFPEPKIVNYNWIDS